MISLCLPALLKNSFEAEVILRKFSFYFIFFVKMHTIYDSARTGYLKKGYWKTGLILLTEGTFAKITNTKQTLIPNSKNKTKSKLQRTH